MNMSNQLCFRMLLQSSGYTGDTTVLVHTCIQTVPYPCNAHVARNNKPQSIELYYTDMIPARTPKIMCVSSFLQAYRGGLYKKMKALKKTEPFIDVAGEPVKTGVNSKIKKDIYVIICTLILPTML